MAFTKFVEVGRVILITKGPDAGKIAVIVEIIDHNRALIDGPTSGVARQPISFSHLSLTSIRIPLPRSAGTKVVSKKLVSAKVDETWASTTVAKKLAAHKIRANLDDFQRFKVMVLKQKKRVLLSQGKSATA